jgi:hypothetical protein
MNLPGKALDLTMQELIFLKLVFRNAPLRLFEQAGAPSLALNI